VQIHAKEIPTGFLQISMFGCFMNFATRGVVAVYETMGTVIATSTVMNWSSLSVGILVSCSGIIGVIILYNFKQISLHYNDFKLMLFGVSLMLVSCAVFLFPQLSEEVANIQFFIGFVLMYSIAYPVGNTAALAMFSKIIDEGPQGQMLGWFASAGSSSRIIFPITSGIVSAYYGNYTIFFVCSVMMACSIAVSISFRKDIYTMLGIGPDIINTSCL